MTRETEGYSGEFPEKAGSRSLESRLGHDRSEATPEESLPLTPVGAVRRIFFVLRL